MYADQMGNVQYMPLSGEYSYTERPKPNDAEWHKDDSYEIIYKSATFNLRSAKYNSYYQVLLVDYTQLNDSERNINDVFYTTIRSDWID